MSKIQKKKYFSGQTDRGYEKIILDDKLIPMNIHTDILNSHNLGSIMHFHSQYEILLCLDGILEISCNNKLLNIVKGQAIFIGPYTIHNTSCKKTCMYQCFLIDRQFLTSFTQIASNSFYAVSGDKLITDDLTYIANEFQNKKHFYADICKGKLLTCVSHLMRTTNIVNVPATNNDTILKVLDYIDQHYDEKISLEQLSKIGNISTSHLCLKFKQMTDESINNYINLIRCKHASSMIQSGKYTISETATLCGYNNFSYFSKKYYHFFGELPSESIKKAPKIENNT